MIIGKKNARYTITIDGFSLSIIAFLVITTTYWIFHDDITFVTNLQKGLNYDTMWIIMQLLMLCGFLQSIKTKKNEVITK